MEKKRFAGTEIVGEEDYFFRYYNGTVWRYVGAKVGTGANGGFLIGTDPSVVGTDFEFISAASTTDLTNPSGPGNMLPPAGPGTGP